jgi:ribonucleoside-diphosphate reductase alpha chain
LALQYEVPAETLARKFEFTRFDPSGPTRNPQLREASSLVDYIFSWLGIVTSGEYRAERLTRDKSAHSICNYQIS